MYGGGTFITQNKTLPGVYANFISKRTAEANISDRGVAALATELDFGEEGKVFAVEVNDFITNSMNIFGYSYDSEKLLFIREIFKHAKKVLFYRLGTSVKAVNSYAEARYGGTRGNDISIVVSSNIDNSTLFDVKTVVDGRERDRQTVSSSAELTPNAWVNFKKEATLELTAGEKLTGGENASITGEDHQTFLGVIGAYSFNTLCCSVSDKTTVDLYSQFTKRMRDEQGVKFQLVAWQAEGDHEGIIDVRNKIKTDGEIPEHSLVYWIAGAEAACTLKASLTDMEYDGELSVITEDIDEEEAIKKGYFVFHNANGYIKVLTDINSLTTLTTEKGEAFMSNQTIRIIDNIAIDTASLYYSRYHGKVPNNKDGRASLWNDGVKLFTKYEKLETIEDFDDKQLTVSEGEKKKAVVFDVKELKIINVMEQLYMSIVIV